MPVHSINEAMRFGKVQFNLEVAFDYADNQPLMPAMFDAAFESIKTDIASKAKKEFAKALDIKPAKYETDMMDDEVEAEKVFKPLFAAKGITASYFRPWVPGVSTAAISLIEKLCAAKAFTPEWDKLTPAEILAKV